MNLELMQKQQEKTIFDIQKVEKYLRKILKKY
jgi:hypothetical protein